MNYLAFQRKNCLPLLGSILLWEWFVCQECMIIGRLARYPWFPAIMSRDRFYKISRYLHLVDSTKQKKKGETGYDPLYKVRPLIDKTLETFSKYYNPKRALAIDEMMVGTQCRVHFLQYIPKKKPTKWLRFLLQ